jgi:hypothetical protein
VHALVHEATHVAEPETISHVRPLLQAVAVADQS